MDNNISPSTDLAGPTEGVSFACAPSTEANNQPFKNQGQNLDTTVPLNVRSLLRGVIDRFGLTREQLIAIYDEHERAGCGEIASGVDEVAGGVEPMNTEGEVDTEKHEESIRQEETEGEKLQGEVNRLQSVVQSALENYECSPVLLTNSPTSRRSLTLPNDPIPTLFARELLQRDQALVAQAVRKYLHKYSIPQREVVDKTGINQSHLSQHFTRGVPIKPAKRIKLYHWFEQDQLQRTGKLLTADGSLNAVLDSPKVEGYRRRPRWRWSPVATQILSEAFKKNRFPTREQRVELSRICNEAEAAMNSGEPIQGPEGDTEGITEQRINTWFTNRRKGLVTPSPTRESVGLDTPTSNFAILSPPSSFSAALSFSATPSDSSVNSTHTSSGLTLPLTQTTSSVASSGQATTPSEHTSLATPLAISPISLQTLLNQLQVQSNATPILAQNLGQILVGQVPQNITLQTPQPITLETLAKLTSGQAVTTHPIDAEGTVTTPRISSDGIAGDSGIAMVSGEEEIISNTVQPQL